MFDESNWINRAIHGDQLALSEIVKEYSPRLYNLAFKIMRNKEDAEDVLQDTFIKMIKNLKSFKQESSLYSWLYKIITNTALEKLRKKNPENFLIDFDTVDYRAHNSNLVIELPHFDPISLNDKEFKNELNKFLKELNPKLRIVFILRDIEENSISDTAKILNISKSNVKVRLMRARMFLKDKLSTYYLKRRGSEAFT